MILGFLATISMAAAQTAGAAAPAASAAVTPTPAAPTSDDVEFTKLKVKLDHWDEVEEKAANPEAELLAHDQNCKEADQALKDFIESYPQSTHRWEAVQEFAERRPFFFTELKHDPYLSDDGLLATAKMDPVAQAGWRRTVEVWLSELRKDPAATPEEKGEIAEALLVADLDDATLAAQKKLPVDVAGLHDRVYRHIAQYADDNKVRVLAYEYIGLLQAAHADQVDAEWKAFAQSPNPRIREVAEARVRWAGVKAAPIELKFVSADGAPVDLDKLRGKIVLLDFWATWCPPCREEIPNIVATYQKYHDKGFAVVGVALEKAPQSDKLLAFTKAHGMTWPQLNGGKTFKSQAALDFGVYSIPHTVLLGRDGRVVAEDKRGSDLDTAVRQQLGL